MDYEPVEHLKTHLPKKKDDISKKLDEFLKTPKQELKRKTEQMEKNLKKLLKKKTHVSAVLLKGSEVLAQRIPSHLQFNSTFLLPHGTLLPILSTTLPILLENYKRELVFEPMGKILKEKHSSHDHVKDFLSLSLFEIMTKLPRTGDSVNLEDPDLLSKLNQRGRAAFYYTTTVLDTIAEDAWKDALISVAMERSAFSEDGHMLTSLLDLGHYSDMLAVDLVNFYQAPESDAYPLDAGHFLFGWWFNCPRGRKGEGTKCLAPHMPSDTVAILNPAIRLYCIPSLSLHLIIANFGDSSGRQSMSDVIHEDKMIWKQIYSVVDPSSAREAEESGRKAKATAAPPEEKRSAEEEAKSTVAPPEEKRSAEEEANQTESAPEKAKEKEAMSDEFAPEKEGGKTGGVGEKPSAPPNAEPSAPPTAEPSAPPTAEPSAPPPAEPSAPPTAEPSAPPTAKPSAQPEEEEGSGDQGKDQTTAAPPDSMAAPSKTTAAPTESTAAPSGSMEEEDEVVGETVDTLTAKATREARASPGTEPTAARDDSDEDEVVGEGRREGEGEGEGAGEKEDSPLTRAIYVGWPIAVFLFYTIFSHVWVYWIAHLLWIVASSLSSNVYLPRPKTTKRD